MVEGWFLRADESWSEGVEEDLERSACEAGERISVIAVQSIRLTTNTRDSREKRLSRDIVQHDSFDLARQIRINPIFPQKLVMLDMIPLERHRIRNTNSDIRHHGKDLVGEDTLESEVVRDLVNGEKDVLVCGSTDDVRREEEFPAKWVCMSECVGSSELDAEDEDDAG